MKVFSIEFDSANYLGIYMVNHEKLLEFCDLFTGVAIKAQWKRWKRVTKFEYYPRRLPKGDTPYFSSNVPVFSYKAFRALSGLLKGHGEFLPKTVRGDQYFFFNVTRVVEALDEANCEATRWDDGRIDMIRRHSFFPERLENIPIFKMPQWLLTDVYCTDRFVDRVMAANLKGFKFRLLWDSDLAVQPFVRSLMEEVCDEIRAFYYGDAASQENQSEQEPVTVTEVPLSDEDSEMIESCPAEALKSLALEMNEEPINIVTAIDKEIRARRAEIQELSEDDYARVVVSLGFLWGAQVRRAYGWEWVSLSYGEESAVGLVSPDRTFAIYPLAFIGKSVDAPGRQNTIVLTFNMLKPEVLADQMSHVLVGSYHTLG